MRRRNARRHRRLSQVSQRVGTCWKQDLLRGIVRSTPHRLSYVSSEWRSGRDLVLTRLVGVLLIEALRSTPGEDVPPGLLRGLADPHLASADAADARQARPLVDRRRAREDRRALSRSAFFERFTRTVGLPPMEYLLAWRMAVAKDLLRRHDFGLAQIAERVGYSSASTFSTAFRRHVGQPPSRYACDVAELSRLKDRIPQGDLLVNRLRAKT
jgi:AraC-like DNA-binding protein